MNIVAVVVFAAGVFLIGWTLLSAVYTVVLPRGVRNRLTQFVFHILGFGLFFPIVRRIPGYRTRDHLLSLFAPISLLLLPLLWLTLILVGFTCLFWGLNSQSWRDALTFSGSSLLTLGFAAPKTITMTLLAFAEAVTGLVVLSLQITYLPSIYSAFARRETAVTRLDRRAGSPPMAVKLLEYFQRIEDFGELNDLWKDWELWFAEVEESHTSFPFLVFFRSPIAHRSWITAAGAVMDSAALATSTLTEQARSPHAKMVIRAGTVALQTIAHVLEIDYDFDLQAANNTISLTHFEYEEVYNQLAATGVPVVEDLEQGWQSFVVWRMKYDHVLITLAQFLMVPYAPWSADRCLLQDQLRQALSRSGRRKSKRKRAKRHPL